MPKLDFNIEAQFIDLYGQQMAGTVIDYRINATIRNIRYIVDPVSHQGVAVENNVGTELNVFFNTGVGKVTFDRMIPNYVTVTYVSTGNSVGVSQPAGSTARIVVEALENLIGPPGPQYLKSVSVRQINNNPFKLDNLDVTKMQVDLNGSGAQATLGEGADQAIGTWARDVLNGAGGNDFLFGFNGDDLLRGASGSDLLAGGEGNDQLEGGDSADRLFGDNGNDSLRGDFGDDIINGGAGTDRAIFSAPLSTYVLTSLGGNAVRVSGPDGTDMVSNVELLVFSDQTINWPPPPPPGSVSIADASVSEGSSGTKVMTFTVTRTGGSAAFSVNYATANGSATASSDYSAASGTLSFGAGESSKTISVTINGDTAIEPDETFAVNLSGATNGASIARGQATGTIANDDTVAVAGSVAVSDAQVGEGNSGTRTMTFTVTRSNGTAAFNVNFATSDGSATVAGGDFVATAGTLSFAAGESSKTISLTINGDATIEPDEAFFVDLSGATNGATISDGRGTGTIVNDDVALPDLDVLNTMTLGSQSAMIGTSTTVKYTLVNSGTASAGASKVGIYRSSDATFDGSDTLLTERSFGQNSAQTQVDDSFALTLTALGSYYIIAVADRNNQVTGELSESNNPSNAVLVTVSDSETVRNTDGSYSVHRVDAFSQHSFKDYFLFFDSQDRLLSQTTNNDDGTHFLFGWDARNQFAWSDYRVVTDSLNRPTSQTTNNDDGTHILQGWDVLNQQSWSDYRVVTDSLNRPTSQTTNNDNGTRLVDAWDVTNQFDWSSYRVTYDGLNRPLNQVTSNDNGSRIVFQWDVANQADWANYRITYDSLNRPLSQVTNNDNGSRIVYAWDVQNQTSWSDYRVTYDSLGRAVSQVTNNDNGTHLIYGWDVQNQASWSDYAVTTDSQNRATSQTTNFDNGTHSVTAWDVQNQFNWAHKTDYFDAQWHHLSQQGVYDNGTTWMA